MAYESGIFLSPNDLLDKLRVFLLAQGWTVNSHTTDGSGYRLHVQKTAADSTVMYFNFRSANNEGSTSVIENYGDDTTTGGLLVNGSTGYNAGSRWDKQPGYSYDTFNSNKAFAGMISPISTSTYYFFAVDDSVHIVVEVAAGKFQFISFGLLAKQGTYTGGQFFSASGNSNSFDEIWEDDWYGPNYFTVVVSNAPTGAVYVDVDGSAIWRAANAGSSGDAIPLVYPCVAGQQANAGYSKSGLGAQFWGKAPSSFNGMAAMMPIYSCIRRSDGNYSLAGWPSGVRFLNCQSYNNGDEVTYGSETWKIFHADSQQSAPDNMYCGFAFLKSA